MHQDPKAIFDLLPDGLRLRVRVQPRGSRNQVEGVAGEALRIRLTAPPVDGAANEACRDFLASWLGLPKASVSLQGGQRSRDKRFHLRGEPAGLQQRLLEAIGGGSEAPG